MSRLPELVGHVSNVPFRAGTLETCPHPPFDQAGPGETGVRRGLFQLLTAPDQPIRKGEAAPNSSPMEGWIEGMLPTPVSLLQRLRTPGERGAWDEFVELYTPLLFHWARR